MPELHAFGAWIDYFLRMKSGFEIHHPIEPAGDHLVCAMPTHLVHAVQCTPRRHLYHPPKRSRRSATPLKRTVSSAPRRQTKKYRSPRVDLASTRTLEQRQSREGEAKTSRSYLGSMSHYTMYNGEQIGGRSRTPYIGAKPTYGRSTWV